MAQLVHNHPQIMMVPAAANPNAKDSRWLTLEVCREYQRSKCSRSDNECKFAHPPPHVEVQNGRVVACFDSIKGKCQRKDPPCKYLHPPQHLREQLLQNGRNNLILKNLQLQALHQAQYAGVLPVAGTKTVQVPTLLPGQYSYLAHPGSSQAPPQAVLRPPTLPPAAAAAAATPTPYDATHYPGLQALSAVPAQTATAAYSPYMATSLASVAMPTSADPTPIMSQQLPPSMITAKAVRADKFEPTSENGETVTSHASLMESFSYPPYIPQVCREFQRGTCSRATSECRYAHPADHIVVDATDNHVTVCMDFIKSKCTRDLCKYFHPPSHLQALVRAAHARNQAAAAVSNNSSAHSPALPTSAATLPHPMVLAKKRPRDPADDLLLPSAMPGMVPAYKRIAVGDINKGGIPVYQTNPLMSPLQHTSLMQLQQPPSYIPMSYTTLVYPPADPAPVAQMPPTPTALTPQMATLVGPSLAPAAPTTCSSGGSAAPPSSLPVSTVAGRETILPSPSGLNVYMLSNNSSATSGSKHPSSSTTGVARLPAIPINAYNVEYFGNNKQLRDTLPVCQDIRNGQCNSPYCKLVHLTEDYVEVNNGHVTVCRDFATRRTCKRSRCKYYHIPIELPPS